MYTADTSKSNMKFNTW